MINITFPDGNSKEFEQGISIEGIAGSLSSSLRKISVAGFVNGTLYDLNRPILEDAEIRIITKKDREAQRIKEANWQVERCKYQVDNLSDQEVEAEDKLELIKEDREIAIEKLQEAIQKRNKLTKTVKEV